MKKLVLSAAGIALSLCSYSQCTVNPATENIYYESQMLINKVKSDLVEGEISLTTATLYIDQVSEIRDFAINAIEKLEEDEEEVPFEQVDELLYSPF